jgi:anti-sigma factor RsiW
MLAALGDYLDGEMDPATIAAFKRHLCGCQTCEVVIDNLRHTITIFKHGQPAEFPAELQTQLRQALRAHWGLLFPTPES